MKAFFIYLRTTWSILWACLTRPRSWTEIDTETGKIVETEQAQVGDSEAAMLAVAQRCWESGGVVFGEFDGKTLTMKVEKPETPPQ